MFCPNVECPDYIESGSPGEYREGISTCPKCGSTLGAKPPSDLSPALAPRQTAAQESTNHEQLVEVASFNYHQDADLVVSMLLASGVEAVIFADDCGGVDPRIGFASRTRVMVPSSKAVVAALLIENVVSDGESGGA